MDVGTAHLWLQFIMVASGIAAAVTLLYIPAPYGRHFTRGFGPPMPARIAWMTQEAPSWIVALLIAFLTGPETFLHNPMSTRSLLLGIFVIHYINRSVLYPLTISNTKTTPATVWLLAFLFTIWNGFLQGWSIATQLPVAEPPTPLQAGGLLLWLCGFAANIHCDRTLTALKKARPAGGYGIPRGGLFEWVSAANYLGEILEWLGYCLALQTSAGWAFWGFTLCNLLPRGLSHHRWYGEKFEDYPRDRWAVLPFIL